VVLSEVGLEPWGTLKHCVPTLVRVKVVLELVGRETLLISLCAVGGTLVLVVCAVQVIDVHAVEHVVPLVEIVTTLSWVDVRGHIKLVPVPDAAGSHDLVVQVL
jgi:hypothetical protein